MVFQDMTDYADCVRMKLKMKLILCFNALYMKLWGKMISHENTIYLEFGHLGPTTTSSPSHFGP